MFNRRDFITALGAGAALASARSIQAMQTTQPAMHADAMGLIAGGYTASEILAAFRGVYGERVLMSPLREGFNWLGYIMPFAALITGGVVVAALIRRWGARAAAQSQPVADEVDATPAELEAVEAAVRDDR
jgi:cytochrome c-type biogenesis protein CcmH/NrfF